MPANPTRFRVVLTVEQERDGRGWFVSHDKYKGRARVESGINAHYYRTPKAAIRGWARLGMVTNAR